MIIIRLFFDPGAGVCFWSVNDEAHKLFGDYPVENNQLSISVELREALDELCERFDTSINWNEPQDPSSWTLEDESSFNKQVDDVLDRVRLALGPNYQIIDQRKNITNEYGVNN